MNVNLLIDSVVRQTTLLLAHVATSGGERRQLAHAANEVFLGLVDELKRQGLGTRVIADMFGMALRTYHDKVQRLSESRTYRGRSLWEAVLEFIEGRGPVARKDVLERFRYDDPTVVKSVLKDLVEGEMTFRTGKGDQAIYRAARPDEVPSAKAFDDTERVATFVWVMLNRHEPVSLDDLAELLPVPRDAVEKARERLLSEGRARPWSADETRYESRTNLIPYGDDVGWEAAVFDHYQAMVTALCGKLRKPRGARAQDDGTGGSTFRYDLWPGHPMEEEVLGFLRRVREQGSELRARLATHNQDRVITEDERVRVLFYAGQTVLKNEGDGCDD
jgi:hypothetical protein